VADLAHVEQLRRGPEHWNAWREANLGVQPNLVGANLRGLNLAGANLKHALLNEADLRDTDLRRAWLMHADLGWIGEGGDSTNPRRVGADLTGADLRDLRAWRSSFNRARLPGVRADAAQFQSANLRGADMSGFRGPWVKAAHCDLTAANLSGADLWEADLEFANLTDVQLDHARLSRAWLRGATLVRTDLRSSVMAEAHVYGISAWDVDLDHATQVSLVITEEPLPPVTVDDLEVAQLVHLLITNPKVRQVIDTMTSRVVLILGRFTNQRKPILDAIHRELATRGLVPVIFDFEGPTSRDLTETVRTLAHLARFVIADLSSPRSVAQELTAFVPNLLSVPVVPLLAADEDSAYALFEHIGRYPQVLPIVRYTSADQLVADLDTAVLAPAEAMRLAQQPPTHT
jgi:uncharacterized protein YjbI with pentapeptide repeats